MNTIQDYRKRVVPKDASPLQIQETRKALLDILHYIGDSTMSKAAGVAIFEGICDECDSFAAVMTKGAI